jgi:hypothetical protein
LYAALLAGLFINDLFSPIFQGGYFFVFLVHFDADRFEAVLRQVHLYLLASLFLVSFLVGLHALLENDATASLGDFTLEVMLRELFHPAIRDGNNLGLQLWLFGMSLGNYLSMISLSKFRSHSVEDSEEEESVDMPALVGLGGRQVTSQKQIVSN